MTTVRDLVEMVRGRIERTESERELNRIEQTLASIHRDDVGLLLMIAPDIKKRRRELRRSAE